MDRNKMHFKWWLGFILFCHTNGRENLQYYPGPTDKSLETFQNWFNQFSAFRDEISESLDLSIYSDVAEVQWARRSFIQPQVMIHERYLYDRESGEWTVGKYLDDVRSRYGGIDSILLWASYPNIGTDVRNQFDMLEDVPGGLEALRNVVEEFHAEGVKVLLPYNPWDQGTRNLVSLTMTYLLTKLCKPMLMVSMEILLMESIRHFGRQELIMVIQSLLNQRYCLATFHI